MTSITLCTPLSPESHRRDAQKHPDPSVSALLRRPIYGQLTRSDPRLGADDGIDTAAGFVGACRLAGAPRSPISGTSRFAICLYVDLCPRVEVARAGMAAAIGCCYLDCCSGA